MVSWHYADYDCVVPLTPYGRGYLRGTDGREVKFFVTPRYYMIDGERIKKSAGATAVSPTIHVLSRILRIAAEGSGLSVDWDREAKSHILIDARGERYHLNAPMSVASARQLVHTALAAFAKRRAERIFLSSVDLERTYVSIEDSIAAGNCETETDRTANILWHRLHADGPCAVRADVLLALRSDSYAKRAIVYAAANH